jgi:nucleotide-binding universal stress UspA family protein
VIGSVGEVLLSATPFSVVVAPSGFKDRASETIRFVGVGFSGSDESRNALRAAAALADATSARLRVVTVAEDLVHVRHPRPHAEAEATSLPELAQGVRADVGDAEVVSRAGNPSAELAEAASDLDLMVVGSRGYGPMRHALLGSVSAKLMRTCPAPLLVVPRGGHLG